MYIHLMSNLTSKSIKEMPGSTKYIIPAKYGANEKPVIVIYLNSFHSITTFIDPITADEYHVSKGNMKLIEISPEQ